MFIASEMFIISDLFQRAMLLTGWVHKISSSCKTKVSLNKKQCASQNDCSIFEAVQVLGSPSYHGICFGYWRALYVVIFFGCRRATFDVRGNPEVVFVSVFEFVFIFVFLSCHLFWLSQNPLCQWETQDENLLIC